MVFFISFDVEWYQTLEWLFFGAISGMQRTAPKTPHFGLTVEDSFSVMLSSDFSLIPQCHQMHREILVKIVVPNSSSS